MDYQILTFQVTEKIGLITISRPQVLNALNATFFLELNALLDEIVERDDVKVLIIRGEGEKSFVAGADIGELTSLDPERAYHYSKNGQDTFDRLGALNIPVIAAVNGFALGGGCELAMACDFRIASRNARFGLPEMMLGLTPGYAGTQRSSRISGLGNALYMMLTAEMVPADDALRMGLVQKVVEPEALMEEVMKLAMKMASNGSAALKTVKKVIRQGADLP